MKLNTTLVELAKCILSLQRKEEKTRLTLTDTDFKGRDTVTIVCENEALDLLENKYIEKLADEVWDGPNRVTRSLFFLNTSVTALHCLVDPEHEL